MSKINAVKIKAIKGRIAKIEETLEEGVSDPVDLLEDIVKDAKLMLGVIEEIREDVHTTEEAEGSVLWIAELLGTNCEPDRDIDYDSSYE